ncbi:MAG: hypothetical protein K2P17_03885 [Helicobacteraceae bacterium]|nr:hypothetical protein [Helicobacteraceae bacterium]
MQKIQLNLDFKLQRELDNFTSIRVKDTNILHFILSKDKLSLDVAQKQFAFTINNI